MLLARAHAPRSEDGNAVVVGAEGEDVFPGVAGVGGEMGVVSGLDGAVEYVDGQDCHDGLSLS